MSAKSRPKWMIKTVLDIQSPGGCRQVPDGVRWRGAIEGVAIFCCDPSEAADRNNRNAASTSASPEPGSTAELVTSYPPPA
jgi:hypothetical protein